MLRLNSVVMNGAGGPGASAISLIYSFLLQEFSLDVYTHITINQIGEDLEEFVSKEGKNVHVNIRYPGSVSDNLHNADENNKIRLQIIHMALLRIAETYKQWDTQKLGEIKGLILQKRFKFELVYQEFKNSRQQILAKIIVFPEQMMFRIYCALYKDGIEYCRVSLMNSVPIPIFSEYFKDGRWDNNGKLRVFGKVREVEFLISADSCEAQIINLTKFDHPPLFYMQRADVSREEKDKAYEDWLSTMTTEQAEMLRSQRKDMLSYKYFG